MLHRLQLPVSACPSRKQVTAQGPGSESPTEKARVEFSATGCSDRSQKPGLQLAPWVGSRAQAPRPSSLAFPDTLAGRSTGGVAARVQALMGCKHYRQWFNLVHHNASPHQLALKSVHPPHTQSKLCPSTSQGLFLLQLLLSVAPAQGPPTSRAGMLPGYPRDLYQHPHTPGRHRGCAAACDTCIPHHKASSSPSCSTPALDPC